MSAITKEDKPDIMVDGNVMFQYLEGSDRPCTFVFNDASMEDIQRDAFVDFANELCDEHISVEPCLQVTFSIPEVIKHLQDCCEINAEEDRFDNLHEAKFAALRKELIDAVAAIDKMKFE